MPTFPTRAMRELTDAGDVRRAMDTRRVMHNRDDDRTTRASALYEELRLLDDATLASLAGFVASRVVMIADIIERDDQPTTEGVGQRTKEMGPSGSS